MENQEKDYIEEGEGKNTIELSRPYGGIRFVDMREPTVQDLLTAELQSKGKSNAEQEITMFANLCEIEPDFIKGWVYVIMVVFRIHIDFLHLKCK